MTDERLRWTRIDSPIGPLVLSGDARGLASIRFPAGRRAPDPEPGWIEDAAPFRDASAQLQAWFAGGLRRFELPLAAVGTDFQCAVWTALRDVPFGETTSYGELAMRIGRPTASRAVGAANGANPLPIVVPCHRVIGRDGSLTGFAGGLDAKRWLLAHEARIAGPTGRRDPLPSDQLGLF